MILNVFSLFQDGITQVLESYLLCVQLCWSLSQIFFVLLLPGNYCYSCCMEGSYIHSLYPIKDGFPAELTLPLEVV